MALAVTSCSAWASMSAAMMRGSPSAARIRISVGTGDKIDTNFAGQQLFRRGDVGVARSDDTIHARDRFGAKRHGGNGLSATHPIDLGDAEQMRAAKNFG